jgi:hypothetical protein
MVATKAGRLLAFPIERSIPALLDSLLAESTRLDTIDATMVSALQSEIATRHMKLASLQGLLATLQLTTLRLAPTSDKLLTPEEAAERLHVNVQWLYRNWKTQLSFGVKISRKQLRFSERKLERFQQMRAAA